MTLEQVNESIIDDIKKELRLQGHYLTGELEASIRAEITRSGGMSLSAIAAEYINSLEKYTPPGQVSISESDFQKLKRWVMLRGMASFPHEATGVAAAIVKKWKQEGRPTQGSQQYSQTGKRTEAVKDVFERNASKYANQLDESIAGEFDNVLKQIKSGVV